MNKPKVFTLLDFVTFGLLTVAAIVADIVTWISDAPFEAKAMMTVVSLCFGLIYVVIVVTRKITISSCDFFTECGWGVKNNSSIKITKEEVDLEILKAKSLWKDCISWDEKVDDVMNKNYYIVFEDNVGIDPCNGQRVAGTTLPVKFSAFDGKIIIYKMNELTLSNSALKHEIGHLIYFGKFGILDNTLTHKFMSECKLP